MDMQSRRAGRLLVLDDDAGVAATIAFIAEDAGFEVRCTARPDEFLALVEQWHPTHIALDLLMPEKDGVEVLRDLAALSCQSRILLTSGMGRRILDAALRVGLERGLQVCGVLPKPFLPDTLRDLLTSADDGWSLLTGTFRRGDFPIDARTLRGAVEQRQLRMLFQPKVTPSLQLRGFEALMRWHAPLGGDISPARFIPAAEQSGFIPAMTAEAFRMAVQWLAGQVSAPDLHVAVNLSARDIEEVELADQLAAGCVAAGLAPGRVILELTETSAMHDPANAMDVLTRLRLKGFRLAIDDFGTGYSSMSQLARMPFSEIKIDRLFVSTALTSHESRAIVRSIIELARNLGVESVAEGVEDRETLELLRELNCDLVQGFYIARPMEAADASDWIMRFRRGEIRPGAQG
jgi:EAL domain-containing protein (putative c-di-GMP-specific phosphodiesterase class I)/ActR/RegA family two-component response regulator